MALCRLDGGGLVFDLLVIEEYAFHWLGQLVLKEKLFVQGIDPGDSSFHILSGNQVLRDEVVAISVDSFRSREAHHVVAALDSDQVDIYPYKWNVAQAEKLD